MIARSKTRYVWPLLAPLLAAALAGCASIQSYSHAEVGAAPARGDAVAAADRDEFEAWTIERLKELRRLYDEGAGDSNPAVIAVQTELEEAAVEWNTFLVKTVDGLKFRKMAVYNHSWFQWRQAADLNRTLSRIAGQPQESPHVLPDGRVPNSAFFTRTVVASYTPERIRADVADAAPVGKITITKEKKDGTSEGFFGKDERGVTYIFIFDPPFDPEMQTSAEQIGSTLVRMLGWRVPKTSVCTVNGTGNLQYDGRRATATVAVKGFQGGWSYRSYRDRRDVRALQLVGAWLNNADQTEHNTGVSEAADGVYVYYAWDYGCSLGSFTFRPKWPRLGWQYLWSPIRKPVAELFGPPWQSDYEVTSAAVGYFNDNFDPDRWVPFYPNLAFDDTTQADRCWAAERIAQISDEQIRTVVETAKYTHASDAEHVAATLIARRDRIAAQFLGSGSAEIPALSRVSADNSNEKPSE